MIYSSYGKEKHSVLVVNRFNYSFASGTIFCVRFQTLYMVSKECNCHSICETGKLIIIIITRNINSRSLRNDACQIDQ